MTVPYWIRHPIYQNNQWFKITLAPGNWHRHWVWGSKAGQYFQIAYDWNLGTPGSQFTYYHAQDKTVYKCSAPTNSDAKWHHFRRPNPTVIRLGPP